MPMRQIFGTQQVILFLTGIALSMAQFVMIRDFVSILYGEEVVIVLVSASFFLGLSVGYLLALKLSIRVFRYVCIGTVFMHLSFPFSYRYLAAWFSAMDAGGMAFLALLFGYALIFNTIFATFLPRIISISGNAETTEENRLKNKLCLGTYGLHERVWPHCTHLEQTSWKSSYPILVRIGLHSLPHFSSSRSHNGLRMLCIYGNSFPWGVG